MICQNFIHLAIQPNYFYLLPNSMFSFYVFIPLDCKIHINELGLLLCIFIPLPTNRNSEIGIDITANFNGLNIL